MKGKMIIIWKLKFKWWRRRRCWVCGWRRPWPACDACCQMPNSEYMHLGMPSYIHGSHSELEMDQCNQTLVVSRVSNTFHHSILASGCSLSLYSPPSMFQQHNTAFHVTQICIYYKSYSENRSININKQNTMNIFLSSSPFMGNYAKLVKNLKSRYHKNNECMKY